MLHHRAALLLRSPAGRADAGGAWAARKLVLLAQRRTANTCAPSARARPMQALGLLFDPSVSAVQLVDIRVTGPRTIEADWRMGGYLRFPCAPVK